MSRFISVIPGCVRDPDGCGLIIECGNGEPADGGSTAISIRQQDVRLIKETPQGQRNTIAAKIIRQVYLGTHRDYLAELPSGECVRALTGPDISIDRGVDVWLQFPPERCRALAR